MGETPSHRRRKGRNAFEPGVDPMDVQPYKKGTWSYKHDLGDWLDGWKEAERAYDLEQTEIRYMLSKGEGEFEIYFDDLTEECQERLKEYGFYHDNVDLGPIAILCRPEE